MYRYRQVLAALVATSCLLMILGCGAGAWGIHNGLMRAPSGIVRLGNLELMAFTGIDFSTMRSPRGYYTIWIALRKDSSTLPQPWHPLVWAHQIVYLEVPPANAR
ncbi:MAG TPA: hypothetical protein VKE41_25230 [Roseiflexaceae bacterium]|nr:hypothetical protein [Roseiflexaceae bacterium]